MRVTFRLNLSRCHRESVILRKLGFPTKYTNKGFLTKTLRGDNNKFPKEDQALLGN